MKTVWNLGLDTTQLQALVEAVIPSSLVQGALEAKRFAENLAIPIQETQRIEDAMRQAQETAQFASRILERIPLALPTAALDVTELPRTFFRPIHLLESREFLDEDGCEWQIGDYPDEEDEQPMRKIGFY